MGLKAKFIDRAVRRSTEGSLLSAIFEIGLRFLQFIFGIAVIGLYAQDINKLRKAQLAADSRWVGGLFHVLSRYLTTSFLGSP